MSWSKDDVEVGPAGWGRQFSLWRPCWRFLCHCSIEWGPLHIADLVFLLSLACLCLCNDDNNSEHAHSRLYRGREGERGGIVKVSAKT